MIGAFYAGFRRDRALVGISAIYFLAAAVHLDLSPLDWLKQIASSLAGLLPISLIFALLMRGIYHSVVWRAEKPITEIAREVRLLSSYDVLRFVPVAAAQVVLVAVFWRWKMDLPSFTWDQTLDSIDRVLHFGFHPWQIIHPLVGYWFITAILAFNYSMWFMFMWSVWLAFTFSDRPQRMQFLLSFSLLWIVLGSLLASVFSSAGPCYFGSIVQGANPYAPLMAYLNEANTHIPILSLRTQAMLWNGYVGHGPEFGISAMPSLHNAVALLMVLASKGFSHVIRRLLKLHMVLIFIGSVHLGWHYAVDAYVSWAVTLVAWFGIGYFLRDRRHTRISTFETR
ncbi:MAG: phosphatase PAP2 family protein [Mesorhizobium sp.]